jgi:putative tryptophan/tyrosine transport system substrate-binding protein
MRRRDFIALFGCVTAIAWTKSARTQAGIPLIGFLSSGTEQAFAPNVAGFISGLKETGYIVGQNVAVEYRWAESQYERLSTMANELARRPIAVLVASGGTAVVRAAQGATRKIPIVFATADDPVANGLVSSLNHPGENITGVALLSTELSAKRIGLVRELVPQTKTIALLANRDNPENVHDIRDAQDAANSVGVKVLVLNAAHRAGHRFSLWDDRTRARRRTHRGHRSVLLHPQRSNHHAGDTQRDPDHLLPSRLRSRRRPDELRERLSECLSTTRNQRRTDSQR